MFELFTFLSFIFALNLPILGLESESGNTKSKYGTFIIYLLCFRSVRQVNQASKWPSGGALVQW